MWSWADDSGEAELFFVLLEGDLDGGIREVGFQEMFFLEVENYHVPSTVMSRVLATIGMA